ncbi:MAG: hypothetical protein GEV03_25345 [Streptosporangiales bacterium]|nr:hypothetical protein [Streptosporangiales bacterium]
MVRPSARSWRFAAVLCSSIPLGHVDGESTERSAPAPDRYGRRGRNRPEAGCISTAPPSLCFVRGLLEGVKQRRHAVEIVDYLRIAKRRLAILIAVPVLAGVLAVGYVLLTPQQYTASAYVSGSTLVGGEYGPYSGPQGVEHLVNDFVATTTSPVVATMAAERVDATARDIADSIEVTRAGLSSHVEVTYTTSDPDEARPVVAAVAAESLENMFAPSVRIAEAQVESAKQSLRDANTAASEFQGRHPDLLTSPREASPTVRAEHKDLLAEQRAARETLTVALQTATQAKAQMTASSAEAIQSTPARREPLAPRLLVRALPAVGTGLFLAVGLVALLELAGRPFGRPEPVGPRSGDAAGDGAVSSPYSGIR